MFRLLLTVCIVFTASSVVAGNYGNMQIYQSLQRPGGDYNNFYANNYEQCANACTRDSRCRAFDFDRRQKTCWLKDRVPRPVTNYDVVSGTKRSGGGNVGNDVVGGIPMERGRSRPGGDYTNFRAENGAQCAMECSKDPRCRAFDFNGNQRVCWLKDRVPAAVNGRNIVSGVKRGQNYGGSGGGGYRPSNHPPGDIYWDYASHRPCPSGYVNCDTKGSCGRRGNAETCRNLGHGGGGYGQGGIYWDYSANRPCPPGYVNCDRKGSCGKRGDASRCR